MFNNRLIEKFSYHDGEILEFKKVNNDCLLVFKDGWNYNQINQILFIECNIDELIDFSDIYQFEGIEFDENKNFIMKLSFSEDDIITFVCKNVICKMYVNDELIKEEDLLSNMNVN